ncbi:hypothetical protein HGRIS_004704 [Hohenbuehelia grisea]|uniref:alanine--glyoxylate transaminase n=1 Tax=Hohenbuehelia grisea TaxID=104357 RepID=A0ABR3JCW6_9AGAR
MLLRLHTALRPSFLATSRLTLTLSSSIRTMSSAQDFKQAPHRLLVIPGPIEVTDEVLYANAHPSMSHVSPDFIPVFGDCIRMTREVLLTKDAQPFLIAGSGTLGWDQVAANLIEPGDHALVLHTGYFGDSFHECLTAYGANAEQLKADIGDVVPLEKVEEALKKRKYKVLTFTHVDTSTGVLSDAKGISEVVRRVSPDTLIIMDAVCSVASEEIRMDAWDLDVVLTASQKGLGTPPGLSILAASQRALSVFSARTKPVQAYYASWHKWLPVMKAYEGGQAVYFATPPVNLVYAFHESLKQILAPAPVASGAAASSPIEQRFAQHRAASGKFKAAAEELGLKQVPKRNGVAANGMTALYFPEGVKAADLLPRLARRGIVAAGGLHKDIKDTYFRVGHMGVTAVDETRGDVDAVITALAESLEDARTGRQ